jgi:alcohol dehydrogenase class IV
VSADFVHETLPQRVVFSSHRAASRIVDEVGRLGGMRPLVIASPAHDALVSSLPGYSRYTEVVMHVPSEVVDRARAAAASSRADVLVSVGGGSATGLAKAVALTTGLPIVAVPTTYAGSEATNVWGITAGGVKTTGADPRVLPRAIVYDAGLMSTLPPELAVASGLNALAHGVDSMWGPRTEPIDQALALEGIRALRLALPAADVGQMLYGAYLAAVAFASAGSGLHHKICHVLGGMFNLPHAQTHAVVLPYVLAFNAPFISSDISLRMAFAFDAPSALDGLQRLRSQVGAPRALRDYGLQYSDIPGAASSIAAVVPDHNPRPVDASDLEKLLKLAWEGSPPQ